MVSWDVRAKKAREYVSMELYERLLEKTQEILQFYTVIGIVRWDLQTYMPPIGIAQRSEQLALLSKIQHRMVIDPELDHILTKLENNLDSLDRIQKREVELARREFDRNSKIPEDLISQYSAQKTLTTVAWKRAKDTNKWKLFESELSTLLEMSKRVAEIIMESIGAKCQLDALIDHWEPRMTTQSLSKVFKKLKGQLVPFVEKYSLSCEGVSRDIRKKRVPIDIQRRVVTDLTSAIGYDTTSENAGGRIDESEHPFTIGYYDDVRFTINYRIDDFFRAIFGCLHETGHALINQNQNKDWKWMYLGERCSSGFSESQSRFVENIIGKSPEFWQFYYPRFINQTKRIYKDVTYQDWLRTINIVEPSNIRVTADEMTYALHIIIRFEIEQDLFEEKMDVSEIPDVWNQKYSQYLGVEIESDSEGALQDIQWAWGYWGYFPTYTLGNLYAAMLSEKMSSVIPEWKNHLAAGNIASPMQWLIDNVYKKSRMYDPSEMIKKITGKSLTANPLIKYFDEKYSALFG